MLIVCPACAASYQIDVAAFGAGRKVRCARCRAEWFAGGEVSSAFERPSDERSPVPIAPVGRAVPAGEDRPSIAEAQSQAARSADPRGQADAIDDAVEERAPAPEPKYAWFKRKPARPAYRTPVSKRARWKLRPAAAVAACGAAALVAAIVGRAEVVRAAPDLASLYAAVGLDVNVRGLALQDVRSVEETEEGVPILLVTGAIANISKRPVDVPRLRLAVTAADERELYAWTTVAGRTKLSPGETAPFRARLASPPAEGRAIAVRFLARQDLAAQAQ